jgi:GT2 family glycosyltransferase
MTTRRVSAIIVTHNNRGDITSCVQSLCSSLYPLHEVIVVDHGSHDGTADIVRRRFPDVCVLDFHDNPGFGEGNNRGARVASGEYLLFLNPDATVTPHCLGRLLELLEARPNYAIAAPKIVLAEEPSILNSAGLCVNTIGYGWDRGYLEKDSGQYDRIESALAATGCALLVRADVFQRLGGFDPTYFLYYEDVDLCWRCWTVDRPVVYVPAAVVLHDMRISGRSPFFNDYLDHRNRLRMLLILPSVGHLVRIAPRVLAFEVMNVIDFIRRRNWRAVRRRTQAWNWNIGQLAVTLRRRRAIQRLRTSASLTVEQLFVPGAGAPQLKAALPTYPEAYEHQLDRERLSPVINMGVNDIGAIGLGWYAAEVIHGRTGRWCCDYGIVFIGVAEQAQHSRLTITCTASRAKKVSALVNGRQVQDFIVKPDQWQEVEVLVDTPGDFARIEFVMAPESGEPVASRRRVVGIAVARICLDSRDKPQ